jgi:hypothetical protein
MMPVMVRKLASFLLIVVIIAASSLCLCDRTHASDQDCVNAAAVVTDHCPDSPGDSDSDSGHCSSCFCSCHCQLLAHRIQVCHVPLVLILALGSIHRFP